MSNDHHCHAAAAIVVEPRAEPFTPEEDPATPAVGKWFWLKLSVRNHVGWEPKKSEDDDDVAIEEEAIERRFVCVVRLGSNYVKVEGLDDKTWRIHFDDFHDECEFIPDPQSIIAEETKRRQSTVVGLMEEIRDVTARLAITPGLGLPGANVEAQSVGLVLAKDKPATDYKTALVKAEKETLPELFNRIKDEHAAMARWMKAPLIPLQANSAAMKPAISAIKDRLFSVELYAGLCEEVKQIKNGEPAKLTEKVRVFQRRAYMNEECLAAYETGGMDYKSVTDFERWLCKPAQLERLMPFPRCVLAFQIRRNRKEREMVTISDFLRIRDEERWDKSTFLYIRNGQRMYRLETKIDFETQLFPDMRREAHGGDKLYARQRSEHFDVIGENELKAMREAHEQAVADWKIRVKSVPKEDLWCRAHRRPTSSVDEYSPFDQTNVYYDDIAADIAADMTRHNRMVLVLQGLLDRSEALHPHPPWSLWRQDGFTQAIELIYDDARVLTPGEQPDFEAYRAKCNASLRVGSVTLGQHGLWESEAAKENAKHYGNSHYRDRNVYYPRDNPGPGKFAHVVAIRGDRCYFQWNKPRRAKYGQDNGDVGVKFSAPIARLFHVDAYRPGDFRLFFSDPRTRAEYLQWAPILLEAEEYHAGNRTAAPVKPPPPAKPRTPGGSNEYRERKQREAMIGLAVRLKHDVTMRSGDVNKKGTLWRIRHASKKGYDLMPITKDGKRMEGGRWMMRSIPSSDFEPVLGIPGEPKGKDGACQ